MTGLRAVPDPARIPDRHVHTEWSWDAALGEMTATCAGAVELGLPAVAFTEHADFNAWVPCPAAGVGPPVAGSRKDAGQAATAAPPNRWAWSPGRLPGHRWPVRTPATPTRSGYLDIAGYWEAIDRCRSAFVRSPSSRFCSLSRSRLLVRASFARSTMRRPISTSSARVPSAATSSG